MGQEVAQLVESLLYKPEGSILIPDGASNRNEYHEYFQGDKEGWCVGLSTLSLSCADSFEM
jgi:hypothetical protein